MLTFSVSFQLYRMIPEGNPTSGLSQGFNLTCLGLLMTFGGLLRPDTWAALLMTLEASTQVCSSHLEPSSRRPRLGRCAHDIWRPPHA